MWDDEWQITRLDTYLSPGQPHFHQRMNDAYRLAAMTKQEAIEARVDPDLDPGYCSARSLVAAGRRGRLNTKKLAQLENGLA